MLRNTNSDNGTPTSQLRNCGGGAGGGGGGAGAGAGGAGGGGRAKRSLEAHVFFDCELRWTTTC